MSAETRVSTGTLGRAGSAKARRVASVRSPSAIFFIAARDYLARREITHPCGGAIGSSTVQASAPATTVPVETSLVIVAVDTPTAASMVWPKEARLLVGLMSPLEEAAPVLESMASAP